MRVGVPPGIAWSAMAFAAASAAASAGCSRRVVDPPVVEPAAVGPGSGLTPLEELGKLLAFDETLSEPDGRSCATCHDPSVAFTDPDRSRPVSAGAVPGRVGSRNSPTWAYASFTPPRRFDPEEGIWVGGLFWDGRVDSLAEQAKLPFLEPLEMNAPDAASVVAAVRAAPYADRFRAVFGADALDDVDRAYDRIAEALAAFQSSREVVRFDSKYDAYLAGRTALTPLEARGLELFEGQALCSECHPSRPAPDGTPPLFTDFTYDNLGTPRNPDNPFYHLPPEFNPDGPAFIDRGLGAIVDDPAEDGKFKVSTLRSIALTAPYMHNGVFATLRETLDFYNTRDVGEWPPPEVAENVNTEELGNLELTDEDIDALLAFLETLTDGWDPGTASAPEAAAETPAEEVLRIVCNATCGGAFAFVTPYRDAAGRLVRLELRGDIRRCSHPPTLFFDAAGDQTAVIPNRPVVPGSDEALGLVAVREAQTGGLFAGPTISCARFHE
jgi:cytochrome c peroxidase